MTITLVFRPKDIGSILLLFAAGLSQRQNLQRILLKIHMKYNLYRTKRTVDQQNK